MWIAKGLLFVTGLIAAGFLTLFFVLVYKLKQVSEVLP
jgi:hypothetical protein